MSRIRTRVIVSTFVVAALLVTTEAPRFLPESSPVARGQAAAGRSGCINCHGQPDTILVNDADLSCDGTITKTTHKPYVGQCSDLLAYFEVVRVKRSFEDRARTSNTNSLMHGEYLARQYNCFLCHGELGQGGIRNAGALKGYIPGYFGNDFELLTEGGTSDSVRSWIRDGIDQALFARPLEGRIAEFFINRQEISMPIFGSLPDAEIQILADYVVVLNRLGPMDARAIRSYARKTQHVAFLPED